MNQYDLEMYIVTGVFVVICLIGIFIFANYQKNKGKKYLEKNPGSAIVFLYKKEGFSTDYADGTTVVSVDGENVQSFNYKTAFYRACYIKPGNHTLVVKADYSYKKGKTVKVFKINPVELEVSVKENGCYSLDYYVPDKKFIFQEFENPFIKK